MAVRLNVFRARDGFWGCRRRAGFRQLLALSLALGLAGVPGAGMAAGRPADLKVEFSTYDQTKHEAHLTVANVGDDPAPATTLQVQTLAPGANSGKPTGVNVPTLKGGETFQYGYKLDQDCAPGLRVQAQDTLAGDPTPDNNTLIVYPCQPDLKLTFQGRQSDQDLQFRITNVGGVAAAATTVHFETETTPSSDPLDVKLPALDAGQSRTVDYPLTAPCEGLAVKGQVPLDNDADPSDNTLQLFACDADLTINYQGFLPNSDHDMTFVVSNVGGASSPATVAHIATVLPAPPSNPRDVPIAALDPGASSTFTYSLAAGCDGNDVKASVVLDTDPDQANLSTQVTACASIPANQKLPLRGAVDVVLPKPSPAPDTQIQRGEPTDISRDVALATPDYLQPDHEMDFNPTVIQEGDLKTDHPGLGFLSNFGLDPDNVDPGTTRVGWAQGVGSDGTSSLVAETAVRFDISPLLQGGPKLVTSATLNLDELEWKWTDGDGNERSVAGCVAAVGTASSDFVADPPTDGNLYPNDTYVDDTPSATTVFDVTVPVASWFDPASPRFGFVFKGSIEDLQNDDQSSCMSEIRNTRLIVDYTVL